VVPSEQNHRRTIRNGCLLLRRMSAAHWLGRPATRALPERPGVEGIERRCRRDWPPVPHGQKDPDHVTLDRRHLFRFCSHTDQQCLGFVQLILHLGIVVACIHLFWAPISVGGMLHRVYGMSDLACWHASAYFHASTVLNSFPVRRGISTFSLCTALKKFPDRRRGRE
jgi:hypothetical protein